MIQMIQKHRMNQSLSSSELGHTHEDNIEQTNEDYKITSK